ncbi:hypothetical protein [Micromonospora sp. LOL_021]
MPVDELWGAAEVVPVDELWGAAVVLPPAVDAPAVAWAVVWAPG